MIISYFLFILNKISFTVTCFSFCQIRRINSNGCVLVVVQHVFVRKQMWITVIWLIIINHKLYQFHRFQYQSYLKSLFDKEMPSDLDVLSKNNVPYFS